MHAPGREWLEVVRRGSKGAADPQGQAGRVEVKRVLSAGDVRQHFFQTVSNGTRANRAYLAAAEIRGEDTLSLPGPRPDAVGESDSGTVGSCAMIRGAPRCVPAADLSAPPAVGSGPPRPGEGPVALIHRERAERRQTMPDGQVSTEGGEACTAWLAYPSFERREDQLREKIQSKMTVSTFLGGFAFTALLQIVSDPQNFAGLPMFYAWILRIKGLDAINWQETSQAFLAIMMPLAAVCLTFSVVLFIGTVYSYDNLAMPFHRWGAVHVTKKNGTKKEKVRMPILKQVKVSEKTAREDDIVLYLYSFMIRVWSNGFNWAVGFSALGLFFILCRGGASEVPACFVLIVLLGWAWVSVFVRPRIEPRD
jgi:hypothetical protein